MVSKSVGSAPLWDQKALRLDNGPELLVEHFVNWCQERNIEFLHTYILPGKPDRNAFIERFNRTYREEVLDTYLFETSDQVREVLEQWLQVYDEERFHEALLECRRRPFGSSPLSS